MEIELFSAPRSISELHETLKSHNLIKSTNLERVIGRFTYKSEIFETHNWVTRMKRVITIFNQTGNSIFVTYSGDFYNKDNGTWDEQFTVQPYAVDLFLANGDSFYIFDSKTEPFAITCTYGEFEFSLNWRSQFAYDESGKKIKPHCLLPLHCLSSVSVKLGEKSRTWCSNSRLDPMRDDKDTDNGPLLNSGPSSLAGTTELFGFRLPWEIDANKHIEESLAQFPFTELVEDTEVWKELRRAERKTNSVAKRKEKKQSA